MIEIGRIFPSFCCSFSGVTSERTEVWRCGLFGAAIGACLMAATALPAAAAGVLSEFEARCLTPMIEVRESKTRGLTLTAARTQEQVWAAPAQAWQLVRSTADAVVQFCAIHGDFGAEVDAWAEAAVASGTWVRIDRTPETLQSTFQREPLIEVEIDRAAAPPRLSVIETNLES